MFNTSIHVVLQQRVSIKSLSDFGAIASPKQAATTIQLVLYVLDHACDICMLPSLIDKQILTLISYVPPPCQNKTASTTSPS